MKQITRPLRTDQPTGGELRGNRWLGHGGEDERNDESVKTKIEFFGDLSPGGDWLAISAS
jgi:hypothetical protein